MFIFIHISSSTIIFNIHFLAHGKKDKSCLHEITVESMFKPFIYIICYNTWAFMLKYIFIHSFIHTDLQNTPPVFSVKKA